MRRFSQRSSLVTLSEINITPLLDLAFVLLIIFVITTPLLEKGLELKLPKTEGQADKTVRKEDVRTVEITAQGVYALKGRPVRLDQLIRELVADFRLNPNLVVYIRADENSRTRELAALISGCQQNGITRYSLRTQPPERR
ncbi:MAG TPA: biopolymer transporter ExbD [Verrucomicrobiota bacterium]|jgi:biopolymer transport protein ExbD|nr:biopolymer transporter ExbD [Verrucomicrobiota bacterium]OQC24218.1 MAG: Biopolymer transport protein ExbD [Verrucomicrobia bacterium ADurb.Bin063]HCL91198.1 biopolymer transporter ExbD [Limisphaerales bacterium]HRR65509.1 biopolymer transporter ExbD [Candidatus Paceibacterota bacterium]MBP8015311.1 biopolymer transporter ExbD [Verrucomicrobiota bacterium]